VRHFFACLLCEGSGRAASAAEPATAANLSISLVPLIYEFVIMIYNFSTLILLQTIIPNDHGWWDLQRGVGHRMGCRQSTTRGTYTTAGLGFSRQAGRCTYGGGVSASNT
jgi:hypothetical protein